MAPKPPTLLERLLLLPNVGRIIFAVILRLLSRPFIGGARQRGVIKDALFAGIRTNLNTSTIAQEQFVMGTTQGMYKQLCWRNSIKPDTQELKSGVRVHWLGNRNAKKVILFFHGGGYVLPCTPGHWQFMIDLQKWLSVKHDIAIAALGYTLAPEMQYPGQLKQAAEALEMLFVEQRRKPSDIFIGGDSAGGNLCAALTSHLLHPHKQVQDLTKYMTEPLAGAIFISPWVQWLPAGGSSDVNIYSDIVTKTTGERWSKAIRGDSPTDNYQEPALAEQSWFKDTEKVAKHVIVWAGGSEMLCDSIVRFGALMKSVHSRAELVVQPGAGHEDMITCRLLHISPGDDHTKLLQAWIEARV